MMAWILCVRREKRPEANALVNPIKASQYPSFGPFQSRVQIGFRHGKRKEEEEEEDRMMAFWDLSKKNGNSQDRI